MNIRRIDTRSADAREQLAALRKKLSPRGDVVSEAGRRLTVEVFGEALTPAEVVAHICDDVRDRGLEAALDFSQRLDGGRRLDGGKRLDGPELTAATLRVPAADLEQAHAAAEPGFLATVRRIRGNIERFQRAILHADVELPAPGGGTLRQNYLPLDRAGLCIPGGAAAYPSTLLMTALPAQVAGVRELAVVAPPTPFGAYNGDLLAVCHELGIDEVYRLGGAQGVAALAYGVEGVARVDKIVGPGNLFVALAKQRVFGEVDIDSIAGPSEVVVVADETARPEFVAAELIAQAEHSPGASILITTSAKVLEATAEALDAQLATLARGDLARRSLEQFGALLLAAGDDEAAALANELAPEHLHIATADPEAWLPNIPSAGAVFLGPHSPVAAGDYVAGPSHVLPTGGTARFASGLSSNDFLRSRSVIQLSADGLASVAGDLCRMAELEGLTAHAASARIRLGDRTANKSSGSGGKGEEGA